MDDKSSHNTERITFLNYVVDNLDGVCYLADVDTYELLFMNKQLLDLIGCEGDEFRGKKCYEVLQNKTAPCDFCTNKKIKENEFYKWEHYNDFLQKYYEIKDTLVVQGDKNYRLEIATDITAQKEKLIDLEAQMTAEQLLVECASTLCKVDDINNAIDQILATVGAYYKANRAYLFEIDESEQYTNNTNEWCAPNVEPQLEELQKVPISIIADWMEKFATIGAYSIDSLDGDLDINSSDYKILEMQDIKSLLTVPLINDGKIVGFIGVDDPTINKENLQLLKTIAMFILDDLNKINLQKRLEFLTNRDKLTTAFNRNFFEKTQLDLVKSNFDSVGIIYVDINGLRAINNKYGHSFGNNYIVNCVQILQENFEDTVYRIGADEFIVLLIDISYSDFDKKIVHLDNVLAKHNEISMAVGGSWCNDVKELGKYIVSADTAMLQDKEKTKNNIDECIQYFKDSSEDILLKEINNERFEILLQPKLSLDNNKIIGAEALVRKKDEFGNYIAPYLFIPRYESQGSIFLIDLFVLRKVCKMLASAKNNGIVDLPHISLNYSRVTLLAPNIQIKSKQICDEYGIDPSMITVEVTEDCGFVESAAMGLAIEKLKDIGFKISLDDFGCKYSNIEIISSISFDEVKIDKSLLSQAQNNNTSKQIILDHLINMFQESLDIKIVIEGIENEEHLNLLKAHKGLIGQGYLFARPMSIPKFWEFYNVRK